ncbi:MAG: hypothetical protein IJ713_07535 [Oscillibacter sp.]|nr:hypothetical protein [Oscillibacter sp.]
MSCYPSQSFKPGIPRACGASMGGLRRIFIATFNSNWPNAQALFIKVDIGQDQADVHFAPCPVPGSGRWGLVAYVQAQLEPREIISAIIDDGDPGAKFYEVDVSRTGAAINATTEVNEENNTTVVDTVITIPVARLSAEGVSVVNQLLQVPCFVVAEDWAGHLIPVGLESPACISSANLATGAAPGDRSGETFEIHAYSAGLPPVSLDEYDYQATAYPGYSTVSPEDFRAAFVFDV